MSDVTDTGDERTTYQLRDVARRYGDGAGSVDAVRDVDLAIGSGEFVAVVGPSGSGKTTLLQLLGGLDRPTSGEVLFEGRDLARLPDGELARLRRDALGFVFQQFNLIPTLTAAQNVEVALAPRGLPSEERRQQVGSLLDSVGLADRAGHLPGALSGGEQQRVAIARALANDPHVVLADEPTGNLDSETGDEIIGLLGEVAADRRRTVVVVTHDTAIASRATRTIHMRDGRLVA